VIRGYHAEIDPAAVGRGFEVTVHVELTLKDRTTVEAFETAVAALDEVVECQRMFGLPDYVIRVAVANQAAYETFYMNELAELPGLARVNSTVRDEGREARRRGANLTQPPSPPRVPATVIHLPLAAASVLETRSRRAGCQRVHGAVLVRSVPRSDRF
jgi:DNA-binding Lrp family transcriptional regulator